MSINTSNLVARPLFCRKMVACFCLLSLILLPTHKVFSAGTMEYYHYDSHGSLLDVYQTGSNHQLSQRWNAWGERKVLRPTSLQDSFLPSKNIPVYLGYKGAKPIADDSLVLFNGGKAYAPHLHSLVHPGGATAAGRRLAVGYAHSDPLNQEYEGPEVKKEGPGWRNIAYGLEMAAAVFITGSVCAAVPEICGAVLTAEEEEMGSIAASVGQITLKATTGLYGADLFAVGGVGGLVSCPIAWTNRSNTTARGWCKGSLSAIHTGARIALSYAFSGALGTGDLDYTLGPSRQQLYYAASFTVINGTSSIASMSMGDSWTSMSSTQRKRGAFFAYGIAAIQAFADMYSMRWLEGFGAFQVEEDVAIEEFADTPVPGASLQIDSSGVVHNVTKVPWKGASRLVEVVGIMGVDLAAAANRKQKMLSWKEVGCQMLSTVLYQGARVAVANRQDGATWGRSPGSAASGMVGIVPGGCGGSFDAFF